MKILDLNEEKRPRVKMKLKAQISETISFELGLNKCFILVSYARARN